MFKDLDILEFLKNQLNETTDEDTKEELLHKIRKYTRKIIEDDIKESKVNDEINSQNEKDLMEIIDKTNNIVIIANTLTLLINAMRKKENKIILKENNIKNNSLNNKKSTNDKNEEDEQISNVIEEKSEKHNVKNKRIFNNTRIEIKGDYTRENRTKKNKIIPVYNFCYDEDNLLTRFIFKNSSKNYEFYYCYKSGIGCKGKGKYDIKTKEFKVYVKCDKNINHEKNTFHNYEMKVNNNKIVDIDMNLKCNQRYYVRYLLKHKIAEDKNTIVEKLKELLGKNNIIKLTDNDINYEKSLISTKINDENILSLIENLKSEINDLIIKKQDIIYEIQTKNIEDKAKYLNKKEEEVIPYFLEFKPLRNFSPLSGPYFLIFRKSFKLSLIF